MNDYEIKIGAEVLRMKLSVEAINPLKLDSTRTSSYFGKRNFIGLLEYQTK